MFPVNYYPANYYAPRYWPPGGVPAGVPVTGDIEEFFLQIQQIGTHNLRLARILDKNTEIWTYAGFEFVFNKEDLTPVEIDKLKDFYLSITQDEDINLVMQRWHALGIPHRTWVVPSSYVTGVTINDGSAQRSMITSLNVSFNEDVDLVEDAFNLVNRNTGESVFLSIVDNDDSVEIKFLDGDSVTSRSVFDNTLSDGNYMLTIDYTQMPLRGGLVFGDVEEDGFYRRFGDGNGDRYVDYGDQYLFSLTYGKSISDPDFNPAFDYNGDGDVDNGDLAYFNHNFYTYFPFE